MSLNATLRAYLSPANLMWTVVIPIVLSAVISLWMSGENASPWAIEGIAFETPRGERASGEVSWVSRVFGIYLISAFSVMITRAGAIHDEARRGTLQRTLVTGVPHWEIIAAHVASLVLVGLIQACLFVAATGALGTPWFITGWASVVLPVVGAIIAAAGLAIGIAGLVHSAGLLQILAGGGPSVLAMLGGAFFPVEVIPGGVQRLAVINPVYWAMETLNGGFVYNGLSSQATPLAILLLIGVTGMVIGVQGLRRYELS